MRPASLIGEPLMKELIGVASDTPAGMFVEVGVYKGGSAWFLAELAEEQGRPIHLFDTFTGMPYALPDDNDPVGSFADTDAAEVMAAIPYATVHVGVFPDTLPADVWGIAFAHIDCDQYQSIRACIDHLSPRMVRGGVMWFDDYGCTRGADRAVGETFGDAVIPTKTANRGYVRFR